MRARVIRLTICFFFCGVAAGSVFLWIHAVFILPLVALFVFWWRGMRCALIALAAFLFGLLRITFTFPVFGVHDVGFYRDIPEPLTIQGVVATEPEVRNDAQYVVLEAGVLQYDGNISVRGRVLVKMQRFPEYRYGDELLMTGRLQKPAVFESFSYEDYLAKDGIHTVMYQPKARLVSRQRDIDGWQLVFGLKNLIRDRVEQLFPEPGASIVLGLLLGMRSSIPQDLLDDFQRSGLTHILAISGYNITLLITVVGLALQSCGRRLRFVMTWMAIVFFALLTGLSASVVRASIMGGLTVFTLFQGRRADGILILLMSGFFMVLANPRILVWDISFQLSFVSTLGLMTLMPLWEPFLKRLPALVSEGLAVTLAATIFTTPVALYHFGTFSVISPLANVVFLPLIPLIMFFSFGAILSSFLFLPVTFVLVGLCWVLLFLLVEGVGIVAAVPFAFLQIPPFPWWGVLLYYSAIWFFMYSYRLRYSQMGPI